VVIPDGECTGPRLATEIDALCSDPDRLPAMGAAAATVGRPDAVSAVAALARSYARPPHPSVEPLPADHVEPTEGRGP
jgi:UDP-N-acetylglucosamine:LPS N-acetylglucosamine transferase